MFEISPLLFDCVIPALVFDFACLMFVLSAADKWNFAGLYVKQFSIVSGFFEAVGKPGRIAKELRLSLKVLQIELVTS